MTVKNYFVFDDSAIFNYSIAYIDVSQYLSLDIFKKKKLKVKIDDVGVADGLRYNIVVCRVRKKDISLFVESMAELTETITACGYGDYIDFCSELCGIANECVA